MEHHKDEEQQRELVVHSFSWSKTVAPEHFTGIVFICFQSTLLYTCSSSTCVLFVPIDYHLGEKKHYRRDPFTLTETTGPKQELRILHRDRFHFLQHSCVYVFINLRANRTTLTSLRKVFYRLSFGRSKGSRRRTTTVATAWWHGILAGSRRCIVCSGRMESRGDRRSARRTFFRNCRREYSQEERRRFCPVHESILSHDVVVHFLLFPLLLSIRSY